MELLLQVLTLVSLMCVVFTQGEFCDTPTGLNGSCVELSDCEKLIALIKSDRQYLAKWHCGFEGKTPKVCCPNKGTTEAPITTTTTAATETDNKCVTLEGTYGRCIRLDNCPSLRKRLDDPTNENLEYVQRSRCIGAAPYSVCCEGYTRPNGTDKTDNRISNSDCPLSPDLPDPNGECCGKDSASGNKITYGVPASIDQYPWVALLEYTRDYICGGSLISNQYVLTAAHCIVTPLNKTRGLKSVRLGEYNTTNSGPDCIEVEGGGQDCTPGAISIPIESVTVHPDYNKKKNVVQANDIALIKLSELAPYNEFIRPICLPTIDITKAPPPDLRFFVSGWGAVDERRTTSDIKLHTDLPFFEDEKCRELYSQSGKTVLWDKQMCAGGEFNIDSCKGDSGGPLMFFDEKKFELSGVISFGAVQCGNKDKPSIYTKVYEYLPWIRSIVYS